MIGSCRIWQRRTIKTCSTQYKTSNQTLYSLLLLITFISLSYNYKKLIFTEQLGCAGSSGGCWSENIGQEFETHNSRHSSNKTYRILYWNTFYDRSDFYVGFGRKPFAGCEFSNCVTTSNKSLANESDALVFHILNGWQTPPTFRHPQQQYVFFLKEPPPLSSVNLVPYNNFFNLTMTYRTDSDVHNPYFSTKSDTPEPTVLPDPALRSLPVAWIVSKCSTSSGREHYVDQLEQYIDVYVFGGCGQSQCPQGERWQCYAEAAKRFHFYLAFENSRCRDYVTEKFAFALKYGMVPIVLGAERSFYESVSPPHSFIHVDDFAHPSQLADHLKALMSNATAFAEYFEWRKRWRVTNGDGWCNLCRKLNTATRRGQQRSLQRWWFSSCRHPPFTADSFSSA